MLFTTAHRFLAKLWPLDLDTKASESARVVHVPKPSSKALTTTHNELVWDLQYETDATSKCLDVRKPAVRNNHEMQLHNHVDCSHDTNLGRQYCHAWKVENAMDEMIQNWHDQTLEIVDQTPGACIDELQLVVTKQSNSRKGGASYKGG